MFFGFARRFERVLLDTFCVCLPVGIVEELGGPGSDEGLIQKVLVVSSGRRLPIDLWLLGAVPVAPSAEMKEPDRGQLREHVNPRSHILGTFGIVRRGSQHRVRPTGQSLLVRVMKLLNCS